LSNQEYISGLGHSLTNKKFRFTLLTKDDTPLTMNYVPMGWETGELTFMRDPFYKGVIESYSTENFEFVKDAKDFVQRAYERGGIDYEITIYIDILINSTFQYQRYFTGKLDLSTYNINSISVSCEIIPGGFQNTILNRDEIKVDLLNTKFIGGGKDSMAQITGIPKGLKIPAYSATQDAAWTLSDNINLPAGSSKHYPGMNVNSTEYEPSETTNQSIAIFTGNPTEKFFVSSSDHELNINALLKIRLRSQTVAQNYTITINIYKNLSVIHSQSDSVTGVYAEEFEFTIDKDVTVAAGDELRLTVVTSGTLGYIAEYNTTLSVSEMLGDELLQIVSDSFPIYEFTTRILQLISGVASPLYSDLLGRTDSQPVSYASDGDVSLMIMTIGRLIRGFDYTLQTFNASLKDVFKTLNSIWNIGLGFENGKVRIEKEAYFFDITDNSDFPSTDSRPYKVNQILDLSDDVTNELISKEVLPDWYHNEIDSGYTNFEYENIQGLKEFNTKSTYATPIKSIKSKLDLVADYRYDTQGVNKLREKPFSTFPTEDVSGDNNVFGFDCKRGSVYDFDVKTDEDFDSVSGGVDPTQSYNLDFTPRRNLERHGNRIRSMQLAAGDEIQWMSSDKNTKLITQKTGETKPKAENGDILVDNLDLGYWIPEAYICEAPVNEDTIAALQSNPRGVIKIGTDKYGWILEVQTNNEDKKGQFKLLRVNLNNVKIVI